MVTNPLCAIGAAVPNWDRAGRRWQSLADAMATDAANLAECDTRISYRQAQELKKSLDLVAGFAHQLAGHRDVIEAQWIAKQIDMKLLGDYACQTEVVLKRVLDQIDNY